MFGIKKLEWIPEQHPAIARTIEGTVYTLFSAGLVVINAYISNKLGVEISQEHTTSLIFNIMAGGCFTSFSMGYSKFIRNKNK